MPTFAAKWAELQDESIGVKHVFVTNGEVRRNQVKYVSCVTTDAEDRVFMGGVQVGRIHSFDLPRRQMELDGLLTHKILRRVVRRIPGGSYVTSFDYPVHADFLTPEHVQQILLDASGAGLFVFESATGRFLTAVSMSDVCSAAASLANAAETNRAQSALGV
jgi:hypothetical protein